MLTSGDELKNLHHVYEQLALVPQGFPQLLECLKIAMTFGVTSASAERLFSSLRRIKTYLRTIYHDARKA